MPSKKTNKPYYRAAQAAQGGKNNNKKNNHNKGLGSKRGASISAPLASARVSRVTAPRIQSMAKGTRIRHREFIGDVLGGVVYHPGTFNINPGLPATFPWLSNMAKFFESYQFVHLEFQYQSTKAATTDGAVYGAIDFDAADGAPADKIAIMATQGATRCNVWQEFCYHASRMNLEKFAVERYVRSDLLKDHQDIKTYDVGSFTIATSNCVDYSFVGELYVEYDIILTTPQIPSATDNPTHLEDHEMTITNDPVYPCDINEVWASDSATNIDYGPKLAEAQNNSLTFLRAGTYLVEIVTSIATTVATTLNSTCQVLGSGTTTGTVFTYLVKAAVGEYLGLTGVICASGSRLRETEVKPMITEVDISRAVKRCARRRQVQSSIDNQIPTHKEPIESKVAEMPESDDSSSLVSTPRPSKIDLTSSIMLTEEEKKSNQWMRVERKQ